MPELLLLTPDHKRFGAGSDNYFSESKDIRTAGEKKRLRNEK